MSKVLREVTLVIKDIVLKEIIHPPSQLLIPCSYLLLNASSVFKKI